MTTSPIVSCVNMTHSVWILVTNYLYNLQVLYSFTRRNLPDGLTDDGVQWALGGAAPGQWAPCTAWPFVIRDRLC